MRPVSSSVSRMAPSRTVSSISRKPPGCAQRPWPGSMPRRSRMTSPAVGDRQRGHHEARVDVGDEAAGRADEPFAVIAVDRPEVQRGTAARAEVERLGQPRRQPAGGVVLRPVLPVGELVGDHLRPPTTKQHGAEHSSATPRQATPNQTKRKSPRPRSTGSQAKAERQMRRAASAVTRTQHQAAEEDRQADRWRPRWWRPG